MIIKTSYAIKKIKGIYSKTQMYSEIHIKYTFY